MVLSPLLPYPSLLTLFWPYFLRPLYRVDNLEVKAEEKTAVRKENLEKFTEYQTRDTGISKNESVREVNKEKVITYVKHLEQSLGNNSNNLDLFGVQTNAVGSKALDLLP